MKEWFLQLQRQEQWAVLIGGTVLTLFLLNSLIWSPLSAESKQLRASNQKAAASLQWMRSAAEEIKRLKASGSVGSQSLASGNQNLSSIVNSTVKAKALPMTRFQPNGELEAQVWLDAVAFDELMVWIYELEAQQGLGIESLSVNKASQSGTVNARVRLSK